MKIEKLKRLPSLLLLISLIGQTFTPLASAQEVPKEVQISRPNSISKMKAIEAFYSKLALLRDIGTPQSEIEAFYQSEFTKLDITPEDMKKFIVLKAGKGSPAALAFEEVERKVNSLSDSKLDAISNADDLMREMNNIFMGINVKNEKTGLAFDGVCLALYSGVIATPAALITTLFTFSFGKKPQNYIDEEYAMRLDKIGYSNYINSEDVSSLATKLSINEAKRLAYIELINNPVKMEMAIAELKAAKAAGQYMYDATKLAFLRVDSEKLSFRIGFLRTWTNNLVSYSANTDQLYSAAQYMADVTYELTLLEGYQQTAATHGAAGIQIMTDQINTQADNVMNGHIAFLNSKDIAGSSDLDRWRNVEAPKLIDGYEKIRRRTAWKAGLIAFGGGVLLSFILASAEAC